jgi:glycosyltransferase involved in cell wall biosynthesis
MPSVSVIIPAYNRSNTISKTISSVLEQTYQDLELIVVDDGSTDDTAEVTQSFTDPRVKLINQENKGAASARNTGIHNSQSDYVTFLDSDDFWSTTKLQEQVLVLEQNKNVGVVYSWTDYVGEADEFLYHGPRPLFSGHVCHELLKHNFIVNGSNLIVRRSSLLEAGGFDKSLQSAHDWDLWLRLALITEFQVVPQVHVFYRETSNSLSSNLKRQEKNCLRVIEQNCRREPKRLKPFLASAKSGMYHYLTLKSLSQTRTRFDYLSAARFLALSLINNPMIFKKRTKLISILVIKIFLGLLLSPEILRSTLRLR